MKESKELELKSTITNTFLKTVSAFSNYNTGKIIFGIDDNGKIIGLENIEELCLDLENKINDNISPKPDFRFIKDTKKNIITLIVEEGLNKPYLYKGKAYKRNDTSTVEVDKVELNRLTLLGLNQYYEELKARKQDLEFKVLKKELEEKLSLKNFSKDVLKTLNLYDDKNAYNNAAELFADKNSFSGIDIAKFGKSINEILDRNLFVNISIISQFQKTLEVFNRYYKYEQILGSERIKKELIPEKAFRETIANALIHRTWDVNSNIRISMYEDKIEVSSPGGLPSGISEKEYLNGQIFQLRNPILANIFFRLKYIEMFGTGIRRINESYKNYAVKPAFEIFENSIKITLPIITTKLFLTTDEKIVMDILEKGAILSSSEILKMTEFKKDKLNRLLKKLIQKNYIDVIGNGRGTKYLKK
ncbi:MULTISPECIES: RNA-binding domain-containing protein [Fusobacterium]|jgi:divergent AAA domain protein|uniref:AAA family ATPase n=1 Tax=Fusobacterium nucleatum subsp. polymorphum TaxID=76857 RepID=A0A2C6C0T1_FUSNP|nr:MULTISPECIES: RNA-binding domain-containing protein [Fusobacterium]EUB31624.1 divergent AAA domain protein [Fusobacterium sp. OBRC1]MBW9310137.1 AAA family ATPase [Fusobacterium nucleatum]PHI11528.1 AAA family ATPase [Fusobacterium polymorphum]WRL73272.1 RNA-binding domain-containing protein [Fusobacterium polymorphum]